MLKEKQEAVTVDGFAIANTRTKGIKRSYLGILNRDESLESDNVDRDEETVPATTATLANINM
jgi:hypothetical protein